jgi:hypothetical protein
MLRRTLAGLFALLAVGTLVLAEESRGTVTKVDSGWITIRSGGGFGKKEEPMEKTFKVTSSVKVSRTGGKDKEDVKLTLDELKTATKVTTVFVTVVHEGDSASEIKVGGRGGFGTGTFPKKKKDSK